MRRQTISEYWVADDQSGQIVQIASDWIEVPLEAVHEQSVTAASVGQTQAAEGKVWAKVAETQAPDGFTLDPNLTEQDYEAWLAGS